MGDFGAMRQALASGIIDGYVSERPEAKTAEEASSKYKMITLKDGGFQVQTMTFPWPLVFAKETASRWNRSIRSLLESVKRNVSN